MWQAPNNRRTAAARAKKRDRLSRRLHLKRTQGTLTVFTQPSSIAVPVPVSPSPSPPSGSGPAPAPAPEVTPAAVTPPPVDPAAAPAMPPAGAPAPEATAPMTATPATDPATAAAATAITPPAVTTPEATPPAPQATPFIPMLAYTYPARIILNDLSPKGVGIFSQQPFAPGMECLLTLLEPKKMVIRGKTLWCDEVHHDSHILSSQPYSYRIGIEFIFSTPAEKEALEKLYQELVKEHLGVRTAA